MYVRYDDIATARINYSGPCAGVIVNPRYQTDAGPKVRLGVRTLSHFGQNDIMSTLRDVGSTSHPRDTSPGGLDPHTDPGVSLLVVS